jgi:hypothetical protein
MLPVAGEWKATILGKHERLSTSRQRLELPSRLLAIVSNDARRNAFLWKFIEGIRDARLEPLVQSGSFHVEARLDRAVEAEKAPARQSGIT